MASTFQSKNIVLTKKLNDVVYEIMVKTNSDMVYVDDNKTLTEKLSDITDLLTGFKGSYEELQREFNKITDGANDSFDSFKEIWDYININSDSKSELIKLIEGKQKAEDGKGLSTHDFDDIMYAKLKNGYTKEELDDKFRIILGDSSDLSGIQSLNDKFDALSVRVDEVEKRPNMVVATVENSSNVKNDNCWYEIISKDN